MIRPPTPVASGRNAMIVSVASLRRLYTPMIDSQLKRTEMQSKHNSLCFCIARTYLRDKLVSSWLGRRIAHANDLVPRLLGKLNSTVLKCSRTWNKRNVQSIFPVERSCSLCATQRPCQRFCHALQGKQHPKFQPGVPLSARPVTHHPIYVRCLQMWCDLRVCNCDTRFRNRGGWPCYLIIRSKQNMIAISQKMGTWLSTCTGYWSISTLSMLHRVGQCLGMEGAKHNMLTHNKEWNGCNLPDQPRLSSWTANTTYTCDTIKICCQNCTPVLPLELSPKDVWSHPMPHFLAKPLLESCLWCSSPPKEKGTLSHS